MRVVMSTAGLPLSLHDRVGDFVAALNDIEANPIKWVELQNSYGMRIPSRKDGQRLMDFNTTVLLFGSELIAQGYTTLDKFLGKARRVLKSQEHKLTEYGRLHLRFWFRDNDPAWTKRFGRWIKSLLPF